MFAKWIKPCFGRADTARNVPFVLAADAANNAVLLAQRQTVGLCYAAVMMDKRKPWPQWYGGVGDD